MNAQNKNQQQKGSILMSIDAQELLHTMQQIYHELDDTTPKQQEYDRLTKEITVRLAQKELLQKELQELYAKRRLINQ